MPSKLMLLWSRPVLTTLHFDSCPMTIVKTRSIILKVLLLVWQEKALKTVFFFSRACLVYQLPKKWQSSGGLQISKVGRKCFLLWEGLCFLQLLMTKHLQDEKSLLCSNLYSVCVYGPPVFLRNSLKAFPDK